MFENPAPPQQATRKPKKSLTFLGKKLRWWSLSVATLTLVGFWGLSHPHWLSLSQETIITANTDNQTVQPSAIEAYRVITHLHTKRTDRDPDDGTEDWQDLEIARGDTLSDIFNRLGIYKDLHQLTSIDDAHTWLSQLHPGQQLRLQIKDERLHSLYIERNPYQQAHFLRQENGFSFQEIDKEVEHRLSVASGSIEQSLFLSGHEAGLSDRLIMQFAEIFGWDIDFTLDLRAGDRFYIVYETLFIDGKPYRQGNILAAELYNQERRLQALRYTFADGQSGYYTPEGRSMRRQFLRTPVAFTRISSGFNLARKHPILGYTRAHKGIDYAAPMGTPIKAAADGRAEFVGWKGGYGNTIVLSHHNGYSTLYAHLSRFASTIQTGARVRQGQTIGYVGTTGLSTGPHLHYELRINGVHQNPLTAKLPGSPPLPKDSLPDFRRATAPLLARLEELSQRQIAQVSGP